ncbi:MAG TPA: CAP domain-containing protein [Roseiarcus sp.]|nr:CAP domain-containing protein [Roseiarcus sp.]
MAHSRLTRLRRPAWTHSGFALAGLMAPALAACASEPPESRLVHAHSARAIAAVRLDPAAAAAELNAYRANRGLTPVRLDPALTAVAERQANPMAAADAISHDVGGSFASRLAGSGIVGTEAGENVGAGYLSLDEAMASWRGSPGHDANLLMAGATRFGVAIAKNPDSQYGVYWAMEVASEPKPRAPAGAAGFLSLSGSTTQTH